MSGVRNNVPSRRRYVASHVHIGIDISQRKATKDCYELVEHTCEPRNAIR